jgi:histidinol-phosphate aminotransferase
MGDLTRSSCDFVALASTGVRGLHPYQPGKPSDELERELGISNIVKLASNENPLGPSPMALEAISQELPELTRYPDGNGFVLKRALCEKYGLSEKQITLGNGSNDVLELITRAFAEPGREVIFSQYAFAVYPLATQSVNATAVVTPAKDWGHDLSAMLAAITERTSIIFVANPNNPTGTALSRQELHDFLAQVPERVIVVLDEAYVEYNQGGNFPDGLSFLSEFSNLIVTRTFSKAWGLAGLRVGYSVSNPEIADVLNRVRQPFNVNSLALVAASAALFDSEYLNKSVEINRQGMQQLVSAFERLGYEYIPSFGNFVCYDTKASGVEVYQQMLQQGVIVRPVSNYGMERHLRISVGLPEENARFIEVLESLTE